MTLSASPQQSNRADRRRSRKGVLRRAGKVAAVAGMGVGLTISSVSPASADAYSSWIIEGPESFELSGSGGGASGGLTVSVPYGELEFAVKGEGGRVDALWAQFLNWKLADTCSWKMDFHYSRFNPQTGGYDEVYRLDDTDWHGCTDYGDVEASGPLYEFGEGGEGLACVTFAWNTQVLLKETHCHHIKPSSNSWWPF
jgi:hypothetical protein